MTDTSNGYLPLVIELLNKIETEQLDNIKTAAKLMADAIEDDRLINVYGGGGRRWSDSGVVPATEKLRQ